MLVFKELRWGWAFSYGDNNKLIFDNSKLTQILGFNGHGKSSIALILEEVIYNKNSKEVKKADILNRYGQEKAYWIELDLEKNSVKYTIKTRRGATQTYKLFREGVDISAHTPTQTYKLVEELIGYPHTTFKQIVYQSHSSNLEFLTATDTNRKKFLIELLDLSRYSKAAEVFKEVVKELNEDVLVLSTKVNTAQSWIDKYSAASLDLLPIQEIPAVNVELVKLKDSSESQLKTIELDNKAIRQNLKYIELRNSIPIDAVAEKPSASLEPLKVEQIELDKTLRDQTALSAKMKKLGKTCVTCMQPIDSEKLASLISDSDTAAKTASTRLAVLTQEIKQIETELNLWKQVQQNKQKYEELNSLIKPDLPLELLDASNYSALLAQTSAELTNIEKMIADIKKSNQKAVEHNAKSKLILEQLAEQEQELKALSNQLFAKQERLSVLNVLVKTFSPTGLVAYKIESSIKDLEVAINEYLNEISSGRFQLSFKIQQSDKLNVIINDSGHDIDISNLSTGEKARVGAATLLGIRKLMQAISNSRTNLLILDETIGNLDKEGKEKLIEILLSEDYLNTFVISHGFTHPLLDRIEVLKKNNISRIQYDS